MEFVFGNGELLVIECGTTQERNIIVERKGNGICGSFCDVEGRMPGDPVLDFNDIKSSADSVVLTFKNPLSILTLMEKCAQALDAFMDYGYEVDFNSDYGMANSIDSIWRKFYNM